MCDGAALQDPEIKAAWLSNATPPSMNRRGPLDLPDASANRAGSSGLVPNLRQALEPKTVSAAPNENYELRDLTRRFWIGAALSLPVFILGMLHTVPAFAHLANSPASRWAQFVLSTPVVLWAGWPFFSAARNRCAPVAGICSR
jgi:cation transport ATPase